MVLGAFFVAGNRLGVFQMIVVMKKGASQGQVDHIIEKVESFGLKSHVIVVT